MGLKHNTLSHTVHERQDLYNIGHLALLYKCFKISLRLRSICPFDLLPGHVVHGQFSNLSI
jgi:hypothetical protein